MKFYSFVPPFGILLGEPSVLLITINSAQTAIAKKKKKGKEKKKKKKNLNYISD